MHLLSDDKFYLKNLTFQHARPVGQLIADPYYVSAIDYYLYARHFINHHPAWQEQVDFTGQKLKGHFLNTVAFNLSAHDPTYHFKMAPMEDRLDTVLCEKFYNLTGTVCSCYTHKHVDFKKNDEGKIIDIPVEKNAVFKEEHLLLCHPVKHRDAKPDLLGDHANGIKATFLAFLWEVGLIKEDTFYSGNILQLSDILHQATLKEKKRLEEEKIVKLQR